MLVPGPERNHGQRLKRKGKKILIEMVFIEQSLPFRNFAVLGKLGSGSQRPGDTVDILAR